MRCQKCGKKLKKKEHFCTNCGYYNGPKNEMNWDNNDEDLSLEDYQEDSFDLKENSSGTKKEEFYYENEEFLEAYIGEDYKIIKKMPFNFYAFLLNWLYVIYRKLYLTGGIGLLITAIVVIFFRSILIPYIIITMFILGLLFNKYYIFVAKKKIEKLLKKYEGTDKFALMGICEEQGGVNVLFALVIYLAFLIIIVLSLYSVNLSYQKPDKFFKENTENEATCTSIAKVANKIITTEEITKGKVEDGVCKINNSAKNDYELYLKVIDNDKPMYIYFETDSEGVMYKMDTKGIEDLEVKVANKTITKQEQIKLNSMKQIDDTYNEIKREAEKEDKLISQNKSTKAKVNFILDREKIIR